MFSCLNIYHVYLCAGNAPFLKSSTDRFKDLDKLNLVMAPGYGGLVLGISQILILPSCLKNDTRFKTCHKRLENNHLASLVTHYVQSGHVLDVSGIILKLRP